MVIANLGEWAGLCRIGIALCLALAAFGEQGTVDEAIDARSGTIYPG